MEEQLAEFAVRARTVGVTPCEQGGYPLVRYRRLHEGEDVEPHHYCVDEAGLITDSRNGMEVTPAALLRLLAEYVPVDEDTSRKLFDEAVLAALNGWPVLVDL